VYDAERVLKNAVIAAAMKLDALRAVEKAFDPIIHAARPYARAERESPPTCASSSPAARSWRYKTGKVQDGYSLAGTPAGARPSFDTLEHVRKVVNIERMPRRIIRSSSPMSSILRAGNFARPAGRGWRRTSCASRCGSRGPSERHTNRLMNPVLSGLPDCPRRRSKA